MTQYSRTRGVIRAANRWLRRHPAPASERAQRGFVVAYVQGRWCGGWYETYYSVVTLVSGKASLYARRLHGLPARFEALLLLCRLARADTPGMVCQPG